MRKKTTRIVGRITNDMVVTVATPLFRNGSMKAKKAAVVLAGDGKTVGALKKLRGGIVDHYAIRGLAEMGLITVT